MERSVEVLNGEIVGIQRFVASRRTEKINVGLCLRLGFKPTETVFRYARRSVPAGKSGCSPLEHAQTTMGELVPAGQSRQAFKRHNLSTQCCMIMASFYPKAVGRAAQRSLHCINCASL